MHSLAQKRFMAKQAGKNEVVLTMEEADAELAKDRQLDDLIVKYMQYVPKDVLEADTEEMFGPRPDDSRKRCVYCNQLPADNAGIACCDAYDGSFYWVGEYDVS